MIIDSVVSTGHTVVIAAEGGIVSHTRGNHYLVIKWKHGKLQLTMHKIMLYVKNRFGSWDPENKSEI